MKVAQEVRTIRLRTVVKSGNMLAIFKRIDPEILISGDLYSSDTDFRIRFWNKSLLFEDAGADAENRIFEPLGNFQSTGEFFQSRLFLERIILFL